LKKIFILVLLVALIVTLVISTSDYKKLTTVVEGNIDKKPLQIVLGNTQDADCGMVIEDITYASQVVSPKGRTWFFHDIGGMVNWLKDKSFKDSATLWVYTKDTKKWIDAKDAHYSLTDETPMHYGFGAYQNPNPKYVSYSQMSIRMLRGETMNNPKIRKQLLDANK
jgi:hypothetical protein